MVNGTRSSKKAKDVEDNNLKGGQSSGKKSVNSGAATAEVSGVRRSPREALSKKNMTPSSSPGPRKSERLEKQTSNSNTMTPPAKRKSERIEKQKHQSPLRRSERGKMLSSSGSLGSKKSDKSPDSLDAKKKKEKKEKSVKQLTMETVEVNEIENEDKQVDAAQTKIMDARAYKAYFKEQPKNVTTTDRSDARAYKAYFKEQPKNVNTTGSDDPNRANSERREKDLLKVHAERTCEITLVTSTSQSAEEALENDSVHTLSPSSQKDSCKDMSSNGDVMQVSESGLVAGEMNDGAENDSGHTLSPTSHKNSCEEMSSNGDGVQVSEIGLVAREMNDDARNVSGHTLSPTSQKNSCKDMSSNGNGVQATESGLVAREMNDDAENDSGHTLFPTSQKNSCKDGVQATESGLVARVMNDDAENVSGHTLSPTSQKNSCKDMLSNGNGVQATESGLVAREMNDDAENDNGHTLSPTSQKNSCKDMSSNGDGVQATESGLVAREMNDDGEMAVREKLQNPELVNLVLQERILDCNINLEIVQDVVSSERTKHDIDVDLVAAPITPSEDICASMVGAETLLTASCKRKDCSETCGTCSKRQRVDCDSTKQEICSSNTRWKLDAAVSKGYVEKRCNEMQKHTSCADLRIGPDQNTCIICKLVGELLCCEGKGCHRSYHLSCLEPPLEEFPVGVWHCPVCVRKKIESGVHSVSEGIEAIWDSREVDASEDVLQRQKQYFVKYKGLAHVHNRWLPENQVLLEAPSLVAKYNRRNQGAVWKQQWMVPHRLLQKRFLMTHEEYDKSHFKGSHFKGHDGDKIDCHVEWLVKWRGLGYEHVSWELDNASFFSCPEGQSLIQEYETRCKKAKRASKFDKERTEVASLKLSKLHAGISPGPDANPDALKKLRNYWCKGQNAIVFDDQERILNVISFILSLSSDISQPFLIISTASSLYSWDEEFLHLAPSVDVVVYSGSKEIRKSIRTLEFCGEGGCIMFQVLITSPEVISEDLDVLASIQWEAIIVDDCQRPRIASCSEQIKMLTASRRLLIVTSRLKDNVAEYLNLLSLLDSQSNLNGSDSLPMNSSDSIGTLKERLEKYIVYECKLESSRFVEYWVPVLLSNVQLEQYCFTLLSNSFSLCSPSKTDPVGAVRNILNLSRKCCDHPYVVDQSLQMLLTKGRKEVEFLDVGIKASGKLQLLDAMLSEIKKRELKVLILFQSIGGSGRELIGDILDDFVRQRFGADSYERIDGGVLLSKKQSALNKFNNERERFVFLLETRACRPGIKLSTVGTVIIFGSDWSPMNDLRALQKITLDTQFEQIKIFRLYSSFTVEEKVLMLSKQDKTLDSSINNMSSSSSHVLLKWGASYLFSQLDKFHGVTASDAGTLSEQSHLIDVIKECFIILDQTGIDNDASKLSLILLAKQKQGMYRTDMPLFGEQKIQVMNEDPPHIFWMKLLEGKSPKWKYFSCSSQRNRKRVQHFADLQKKTEAESTEVVKKRKKVVSDCDDHLSPKAGLHDGKMAAGDWKGSSGISAYGLSHSLSRSTASESFDIYATESERRKQRDSQKILHVLLKPQIAKLCEVLHLSEDVKQMVERFLEYVMNNHVVSREPASVLQAFQISVCWTAASLLKQKIDHKESLALAKQHLGFTCKKEEADYIYLFLRCAKRMFQYREHLKGPNSPRASDVQVCAESGVVPEFQLAERDIQKSIREFEKKCDKQMTKLLEKQVEEMKQFNQKYEEEKAQLENKKRTEAAVIRLLNNATMITDKLKKLDIEYARKFDELKRRMHVDLENLEAVQVRARSEIEERKTRSVEAVEVWARGGLVRPPVSERSLSERTSSAAIIQPLSGNEVSLSKSVQIVADEIFACSDPIDRVMLSAGPSKENSLRASVEECNVTVCSGAGEEQAVYKDSCPRQGVSVGEIPDGGVSLEVAVTVSSGYVTESVPSMRCSDGDKISNGSELNMSNGLISVRAPSCEDIPDGATLSKPSEELPIRTVESVSFGEDQEKLASLQALSAEKVPDRDTLRKIDEEVPFGESVSVVSSEGQENFVSLESPAAVEVPDGTNLSKVDGQVPLREPPIANCGEGQQNLGSAEAPSSEDIHDGATLSMANGVLPSSAAEGRENIMSANSLSERQVPGGATLDVRDGEVPKSTSDNGTSSHGMDNFFHPNPSSKEQITETAEEFSLAEPETVPSEVLEGGSVHRENDRTSAIGIEQQGGTVCTLNQEPEFQELSPADLSPVQDVPTFDQGSPLPLNQVSANAGSLPYSIQATNLVNSEMQNTSQVAETAPFNATIDVRCNEPNPDTPVAEHREQIQLLRSGESTCNLSPPDLPSVNAIEHQSSNEGQTANQISHAPSQALANHIELSNQDVLQPLHSPIDGTAGGLVRLTSETRTASLPSASVSISLPAQTAPTISSRMPLPLNRDPLQNEMERIRVETDQTIKIHEDTKLQLKLECEKKIEEAAAQIRRNYEVKLKEKEEEFLLLKKELDENYNKVLLNKILADAFRSKCMDFRASGSAGAQQEAGSSFMQQLVQLSSQQAVQQPSIASGLPSTGSASLQSITPVVVNAQTNGPPLQAVNPSASAFFSGTPTRPPHISSISSTGNLQMSSEIRAPAPHLQPFRPSTSIAPSSLPSQSRGMSSQLGHGNNPVTPSLPSQQGHGNYPVTPPIRVQSYGNPLANRPASTTCQTSRIASGTSGGLAPTSNYSLPSLDVLMGKNNLSGANTNSPSLPRVQSNPAQQSGPPDIVCLSDDD